MRRRERASRVPLGWRAQQLADALDQGGDQLDPALVEEGRALVRRVAERGAIGTGRTVVALAGATGSGKSTLFNRLVGGEVASVGVRRPTTDRATAAIWGTEEADELLDWLDVRSRHHVPADGTDGAGELDGLVLVDLPDFDSVEVSHRAEADRVLQRADAFLWLADPQKYADARLHDDYLRPLRDHEPVMLVLLNQVDRIPGEAVPEVAADLARLVAADGAGELPVLPLSARTGTGVEQVRQALAEVVAARQAAEARLVGDVRSLARRLLEGLAGQEPELDPALEEELELAHHIRDRAREAFRTEWDLVDGHPEDVRVTVLRTRTARGVAQAPFRMMSPEVSVAAPFLDPEFVTTAMSVERSRKDDGVFYREVLEACVPEVAGLPSTNDAQARQGDGSLKLESVASRAWYTEAVSRAQAQAAPSLPPVVDDGPLSPSDRWRTGLLLLSSWLEEYQKRLVSTQAPWWA
ncbi:YfjP family GTPase [Ornithinicoccus halotolerans]|uniref:YfjP family GTPase n=1 Tax=Ornithinicoccus halotolerans TaxID=1748220 RepID=UPI0012978379|nr:YfjP family GTPase [Ornithinicoccus halotolerans]